MPPRAIHSLRFAGVLLALASSLGCWFVIWKLYTGRGGETPIRSALQEQPLVALFGIAGALMGIGLALGARRAVENRNWLNPRWILRERKGELGLLVAGCLIGLIVLEIGSRVVYAHQLDFPFSHSTEELVYPPLHEQLHDYTGDTTNILLLGGSVLYFAGQQAALREAFGEDARVYNFAQTAHSSLDSLTKYRYALDRGYRFDYVIFYHGINEVRANNVPPELFSGGYNHYFFYRLTNTVFGDRAPWLRMALKSSLVYRANRLVTQLRETRFFGRNLVHIAFPREDWLEYGGDIKSAKPFRENLQAIADLCEANGSPLIVPRFAYHPILDDYANGMDTGFSDAEMRRFTEQWGLPRHVREGTRRHNEILQDLSDRFIYIDTAGLKKSENFVDPCHFTAEAQEAFVDVLSQALRRITAD